MSNDNNRINTLFRELYAATRAHDAAWEAYMANPTRETHHQLRQAELTEFVARRSVDTFYQEAER